MWLKWLPWKYIVKRLAHSHGFYDPIALLSHLRRFSQPSEVNEPIELLRAGVILHARGLINSRVIQHNLDWIWPYWVNQQFDPHNRAFIPRAFSLTHINLSNRNWTAIGSPGYASYPIVDPRGSVMPFWDSWSIDAWIITDQGKMFVPARMQKNVHQQQSMDKGLAVITTSQDENFYLKNKAQARLIDKTVVCSLNLHAKSKHPAWLVVSARPCHTEGVSFIHQIEFDEQKARWTINDKHDVYLNPAPEKSIMSDYKNADVALKSPPFESQQYNITCKVGMATAAAVYRLEPEKERNIQIAVPVYREKSAPSKIEYFPKNKPPDTWSDALEQTCKLNLPYKNFQFLYDAAVRSVILHSPFEVYPGPFTYKRFWFRDSVIIIYSMLTVGLTKKAEKLIDNFLPKQTAFGYFHSQQGEWDSNGQVLWLLYMFSKMTGKKIKLSWQSPVIDGAKWITNKRTAKNTSKPHAGLLPAGFSAEHLGSNDFYYWDNFWALAGLRAATEMLKDTKHHSKANEFEKQAHDFSASIRNSLLLCQKRLDSNAIPASPYRRLDSGAIGSIVAGYPLELFHHNDQKLIQTTDYLLDNCLIENAFFHDIIHSGINPYLTLDLAQVLMRIPDIRFTSLVESIANLASPTGQWPEAINPRTGGGCMGDGQHVWASAEWILMIANSFAMHQKDKLILGAGIFPQWLEMEKEFSMGPILTKWGYITLNISIDKQNVTVNWQAKWNDKSPPIEIRIPTLEPKMPENGQTTVKLARKTNR